ncbi:MAG: translation initiation factor eIF3 subunit [Chaenotheca gracillima]|nr:MAG: translation initiation factor eIF3 subunit [Chaenotheca gracillima]
MFGSDPRVIEAWFRRYLADCVKDMVSPCEVTFAPAGRPNLGREIFYSNLASHEPSDKTEKLEIRIRSPEFYNRLAHYAHTIEAFTTELLHTEELSKTVSVSKPSLLPALFAVHDRELKHPLSSILETWHWYLVRCMRVVPPATSNATSDNIEETLSSSKEDIRSLPLSDLDRYVARVASFTEAADYRRAVKKLFLSDRIAFGLSLLLTLYDVVARGALIFWAVRVAASVLADPSGAGRSRDLLTVLFKVCLLNGVNFWALGKSLLLE